MSHTCRESELDALLSGELSPEDEARVRAHTQSCTACTQSLAWLKLERGWMAQRARRQPSRAALSFSALEARLQPVRAHRAAWAHRGKMALSAVAAVAFMAFSVLQVQPSAFEEPLLQEGLVSLAGVEACVDPGFEAVALHEARFSACLLATPASPLR